MKKIIVLCLLLISLYSKAVVSIVYVNPAASGANDGTSWANAYTNLQVAITNATMAEIWVVAGTYYPGPSGSINATFLLKNDVAILGGFDGTETAATQRNPMVNICILSGDLDLSGNYSANDAYHVVTTDNTIASAVIDGFIIEGGNAIGAGIDSKGAGILCNPTTPTGNYNPSINNCIIRNNNASTDGAGMAIISTSGGSNVTASPVVHNSKFFNNVSLGVGSAVYANSTGSTTGCAPKFENCLMYNNSGAGGGHHIYAVANTGGSIQFDLIGCTFTFDVAGDEIVYLANGNTGNFNIHNSIFYGLQIYTDAGFTGNNNCGTAAPYLSGSGNIDVDPLYKNAGSFDYRLSCLSPCIDVGNNVVVMTSVELFGGNRIVNTVDIGAHETNYSPLFITPNALPSNNICAGTSVTLYGSGPGGVSYAWTGGVTDAVPFTPSTLDTYTVTGTDTNGCVATETITITVTPLPTVVANASSGTVCIGTSLFVYGTGAQSYTWDNGVSDGIPFTPSVNTYFTVTGTDAAGCSNTAGVNVIVEDSTMVSAGPDMNVCRTGTPFINLAGNNSGSLAFQWTTDGSGSFTNDMMPNSDYYFSGADASSPGINLICTVNYTACGTTIDTMHVTFWDPASAYAGTDFGVCAANASNIMINGSATGAGSFLWTSSGSGTFSPNQFSQNIFYTPSAPEILGGSTFLQFQVNAVNPACPSSLDTILITYYPTPTLNVGPDQNICQTDSVQLSASVGSGTPPYIYNWVNGSFVTISSTLNEYYFPSVTEVIGLTVNDTYGCSATDQFLVTVDSSNMLSGTINVGAAPLTDGTMYMFKYIPQQLAFDTLFVLPFSAGTGSYSFPGFTHGTYLIKIVPDTLIFPNVLPTYFGDAFQWDSATVINHNCLSDYTANINMLQLLGGTGTGMITGHILEGQGFGTRLYGTNPHIMVPGGPLKGIDVKLGKNPAGGIQARTMSDSTGYYEFTDLPFDSYRIYVDVPGLPMDSFYVISMITSTDSVYNMDYMVDSNSVFPMLPTAVGLGAVNDNSLKYSLYPNPASSYTSVDFELNSGSYVNIELLDVSGRVLWSSILKDLPKGKHQYQINFADAGFVNGMYFIRVKDQTSSKTSKLVIEK